MDENAVINKHIKEFQSAGGNKDDIPDYRTRALKEAFKGQLKTKREVNAFEKKFDIAVVRGHADSRINSLIYANSIEAQMALLKEYKNVLPLAEFNELFGFAQREKIISKNTAIKFFEANK